MEKQDDIAVEQETNKMLKKILTFVNEDYNKDEKITLYKWNSLYMFNDWEGFFSSLEIDSFNSFDDFLDYYYEYETDNVEDGAEFI